MYRQIHISTSIPNIHAIDPMFQEQDERATPLQIARHVGENEVGNTDCLEPTSFHSVGLERF